MPPNSSRVTSVVLAPRSAARSAAATPAGPPPITSTSGTASRLLLAFRPGAGGDAPPFVLRRSRPVPDVRRHTVEDRLRNSERRSHSLSVTAIERIDDVLSNRCHG